MQSGVAVSQGSGVAGAADSVAKLAGGVDFCSGAVRAEDSLEEALSAHDSEELMGFQPHEVAEREAAISAMELEFRETFAGVSGRRRNTMRVVLQRLEVMKARLARSPAGPSRADFLCIKELIATSRGGVPGR